MRYLLDHGVFVAPTGLGCVSTVMDDAEIEWLVEVFAVALDETARA